MEWVLVLIGIAYSIWSTYRKEAKENEAKRQQQTPRRVTPQDAADHVFAHRSGGRRTLAEATPQGLRNVNDVKAVSVEEIQREDFASKLNQRILSQDVEADIRRTIAEIFGDTNKIESLGPENLRPETERYRDYDELSTYDDRTRNESSREQWYDSHFKLNEGLRKDTFKVGGGSGFGDTDFADDAYDKQEVPRKAISLDKGSLKSYYIMHEILSKPRALEAIERRHGIVRKDARHRL